MNRADSHIQVLLSAALAAGAIIGAYLVITLISEIALDYLAIVDAVASTQ